MLKFLHKTTMAGLEGLPRKVAMVFAKGTLDFAREVSQPIVPQLLSNTFPFLQSAGMLPGMLKGERVASLSEAESQNSCPKIRERSAKDPRNIRERSRKPSKPPALQAMGDEIIAGIRFLELRAWVSSNPTSPSKHALWCSRLGFGVEGFLERASAKARDGVRERNFGFP